MHSRLTHNRNHRCHRITVSLEKHERAGGRQGCSGEELRGGGGGGESVSQSTKIPYQFSLLAILASSPPSLDHNLHVGHHSVTHNHGQMIPGISPLTPVTLQGGDPGQQQHRIYLPSGVPSVPPPTAQQQQLHRALHGSGKPLGSPMNPSSHGDKFVESTNNQPTPTNNGKVKVGGAGGQYVHMVKFKRSTRAFLSGVLYTNGSYVKVEADRGEDLGIVTSSQTASNWSRANGGINQTAGGGGGGGGGSNQSGGELKKITRGASVEEVKLLIDKTVEEESLLKICRHKVKQRSLPMTVIDAEYQFDRHKLTFFFEAAGRIDFRELVRDLFSIYKTRIWMQQVDKGDGNQAQAE